MMEGSNVWGEERNQRSSEVGCEKKKSNVRINIAATERERERKRGSTRKRSMMWRMFGSTQRWGTRTSFGSPVVPLVNIAYAMRSLSLHETLAFANWYRILAHIRVIRSDYRFFMKKNLGAMVCSRGRGCLARTAAQAPSPDIVSTAKFSASANLKTTTA